MRKFMLLTLAVTALTLCAATPATAQVVIENGYPTYYNGVPVVNSGVILPVEGQIVNQAFGANPYQTYSYPVNSYPAYSYPAYQTGYYSTPTYGYSPYYGSAYSTPAYYNGYRSYGGRIFRR